MKEGGLTPCGMVSPLVRIREVARVKKATIYSIAESLGVSASTVSRAFSRPDLVKGSVREEILETARAMGYTPNRAARGLATGRTGLFGVIVSDITNPFFPPLVRAIQHAAAARDAEVLLIDTGGAPRAENELANKIKAQVDGLIIASPRMESSVLRQIAQSVPTVVINRVVRGISHVVCDNTAALARAAEQLHQGGHRSFGLVQGPSEAWAAIQRSRAIQQWAEAQPEVDLFALPPGAATFERGRDAAAEIVDMGATAVFAFDDLVAAGVVAGLNEAGEQVPRDRSIVGCDDVLLARTMTPALTTVTAPMADLGAEAVRLISEVLEGATPKNVTLEGSLVLRGTVAPAATRGESLL